MKNQFLSFCCLVTLLLSGTTFSASRGNRLEKLIQKERKISVDKLRECMDKHTSINELLEDILALNNSTSKNLLQYFKDLNHSVDGFNNKKNHPKPRRRNLPRAELQRKLEKRSAKRLEKVVKVGEFLTKSSKWFKFDRNSRTRIEDYIQEEKRSIGDSLDYSAKTGCVMGTEKTRNQLIQEQLTQLTQLLKASQRLKRQISHVQSAADGYTMRRL